LAHANQLPLPRLQNAACHESDYVSGAIGSVQTFIFKLAPSHRRVSLFHVRIIERRKLREIKTL